MARSQDDFSVLVPLHRLNMIVDVAQRVPALESRVQELNAAVIALRKLYQELLDRTTELVKSV